MAPYKFESYQGEDPPDIKRALADEHFRKNFGKHFYGDIYTHEVRSDCSRVIIGANEKQIPLMLEIAKKWEGPYGILYVLKVPRLGHEGGRYQSPELCSFDELELFANAFQKYFEEDGHHHLWFKDLATINQLVYDNHDLIFTYGNDNEIIDFLKSKGFNEGLLKVPVPHAHNYNQEYDKIEDEITAYFKWKKFPLQDIDNE